MRERARAIGEVQRRMVQSGIKPRLQMSFLMALSVGGGVLTSHLLLALGVLPQPAVRYPAAVLVAYLFFLCLLRVWMAVQGEGGLPAMRNASHDDGWRSSSGRFHFPWRAGRGSSSNSNSGPQFGGGGGFGGGGAGGSWAAAPGGGAGMQSAQVLPVAGGFGSGSGGGGGGFLSGTGSRSRSRSSGGGDAIARLGPLLVVLLVVAAVLAAVAAVFYVIYVAPLLFAELIVDGAVVGGLYPQLQRVERGHWLKSAVKRTWIPVLCAMFVFGGVGYMLQEGISARIFLDALLILLEAMSESS